MPVADGDGQVTFDFEHIPLLDGTYLVTLAIQSTDEGTVLRLERSAVPVLGDEPGSYPRDLVALPIQVRFGTPYAERVEGSGT